ncbi:hypothetical protein NDU88_001112 [Pleurodeles waltl]|uniref:Uncharacterized protein n=1 Tax=Pleurodeles waltl TaxID=8319 RepID=A0AAV7VVI3_PLEWA|nr:hypothetical protein NDU88_001112 [Pleurodeles waltl]
MIRHHTWDLPSFTKDVLERNSKRELFNPVLANIIFQHPFHLKPVATIEKGRIPNMETIETEKMVEAKRLNEFASQKMVATQMQSRLRGTKGGARSFLPLKSLTRG